MSEYPKRIEVKCYHTENGIANMPNEVMCQNCSEIQKLYIRKYKELTNNL